MLVYRIEDGESRGPFCGRGDFIYDNNHRCHDEHSCQSPPNARGEVGTPLGDMWHRGDQYAFQHRFGFRSRAQLKRWFRSKAGRRAMMRNGYKVAVYEVPKDAVWQGKWQVVFNADKATPKETINLETLH